jgi:hypothetical protein
MLTWVLIVITSTGIMSSVDFFTKADCIRAQNAINYMVTKTNAQSYCVEKEK